MTLLTGRFFTFQPRLTCFKARFGFCCTFFFHGDGINFGLLLAGIAPAEYCLGRPRRRRRIRCSRPGYVLWLYRVAGLAVPVKPLREQIRRTGIGTGATADAAFSSCTSPISVEEGASRQSGILTTGTSSHGRVAHQRATHDHHLIWYPGRIQPAPANDAPAYRGAPRRYPDGRPIRQSASRLVRLTARRQLPHVSRHKLCRRFASARRYPKNVRRAALASR